MAKLMSAPSATDRGAAWFAKRQGQANAARKRPHKQIEYKRPGKGHRQDWRKEL